MDSEGARFKKARLARGMTLQELAARVGYSLGTISGIENEHDTPSKRLRTSLAEALRVNEKWIRTGKGEMWLPVENSGAERSQVSTDFSMQIAPQPEFGIRLRAFRTYIGLSVEALAIRLECTKSYLYRLERGEGSSPSHEFVARIVADLAVTPELFEAGDLPTDGEKFFDRALVEKIGAMEKLRALLYTFSDQDLGIAAKHFFFLSEKPAPRAVHILVFELAMLLSLELQRRRLSALAKKESTTVKS